MMYILDKNLLVHGEKLTDKHMNLAQRILKLKFPNMNKLRLPLLQDKAHKEPTGDALQIKKLVVTIGFMSQLLVLQGKSAGI